MHLQLGCWLLDLNNKEKRHIRNIHDIHDLY